MPDLTALRAALSDLAAVALSIGNGGGDGYSVPGLVFCIGLAALTLYGLSLSRQSGRGRK